MNLIFRLIAVLLRSALSPCVSPFAVSRLAMRCWPTDLDLNFHMNNGRYLSIMDVGRAHFMARGRMLRKLLARGWMPVVSASTIRYRRPIAPFEPFELVTRVIGYDESWVYIDQRFVSKDGRVKAIALVRAGVISKQGRIGTADITALIGEDGAAYGIAKDRETLPRHLTDWEAMLDDWPLEEPAPKA